MSYNAVHKWLIRRFGKATKCENPACKSKKPKRFEWALIKGMEYEQKRENFIMLCPSCHRKYDITEAVKQMLRGERKSKNRAEPIKAIRQITVSGEVVQDFAGIKEANEITGINLRSIHNVISGRAKTAGGYIFQPLN